MRKKKFKVRKGILSLLLSAALVVEPISAATIVYAEESNEVTGQTEKELEGTADLSEEQPGGTTEEDKDVSNGTEENEGGSDESNGEQTGGDDSEEGSGDDKEEEHPEQNPEEVPENPDNRDDQDAGDEQEPEEGDEIIDDEENNQNENDETSVSENDLDKGKEEEEASEGFEGMPDSYKMNAVQMAGKRDLAAHMDEIVRLDEGRDYVKGEVVLLAESQEEAEMFAEAYNAEIKKFDYGVLTLKLSEEDNVVEAMRAAANERINLPAVWPNYYVYAFGEEPAESGVSADIVEENNDLIEVETSEYDMEELEITDESDGTSYMAALAYDDAYLRADSGNYQYHHTVIGSAYAWEAGYTGSGVTVAVLDTGVNDSNPDLPTVNGVGTNPKGDINGHGTHVAGIIGASANGKYGVGVAPDVTLYACNVLPNDGKGTLADSIAGVNSVSGQGGSSVTVNIINMSLGSLGYSGAFQEAINGAYNNGVAIFAASGNDGGNNYNYPASYDNVISVAATDQNNARASFSNYGDKVDISAPGVDIYSTDAFYGQSDADGTHTEYIVMSGTSMACPVAAGEAAVILSSTPAELSGKTGGDKVDALLEMMQKNAVKVGSGMGAGITNLTKMFNINASGEKPSTPIIDIKADSQFQKVDIVIKAQGRTQIYYTDNGKNPVYKNGTPDANTKLYTGKFSIEDQTKGTVKAIAVNESGVCSKVISKTYTLTPYVKEIIISGVNQVAKGKSVQLSAAIVPSYAANKNVTWEIYTVNENGEPAVKIDKTSDKTLKTGVSISTKGKMTVAKGAQTGSYVVKVTAKDAKKDASGQIIHTPVSAVYPIKVTDSVKVNSVKFDLKKLTLVIPNDKSCDLAAVAGFKADQKDSEGVLVNIDASEFRWSSSNTAVADVDQDGTVTPKKAGKATITVLANDSSGKKATCAITVQQLATGVNVSGSSVIGKGKSITYKAEVVPADTTNKKVEWSLWEKCDNDWQVVDAKRAKEIGVSINTSGKLVTTSKATAGDYQIRAVTKDAAGIEATHTVTVKAGYITKVLLNKKSLTLNRTTNAFGALTSQDIIVTLQGDGADLTAYTVASSNENIVNVVKDTKSEDGIQTLTLKAAGKAVGKATITIKTTDGSNKSVKCTVTVNNPVSGIRIAPAGSNDACVAKGKSLQLKAVIETENGAVSNKKIGWTLIPLVGEATTGVKISSSGKVSAGAKAITGWYMVVASAKDESKALASYMIRVDEPTKQIDLYNGHFIMPKSGTYVLPQGVSGSYLIVTDLKQGGFAVSSTDPAVMSVGVSSAGELEFVTGGKKGTVTITIKAMDGSGKQVKYKFRADTDLYNKL